jgi:hypothetical protein
VNQEHVRIRDANDTSFRVRVHLSENKSKNGDWRALDFGCIKYTTGETAEVEAEGTWFDRNAFLCVRNQYGALECGIRLDSIRGFLGINDDGTGEIYQSWVVSLVPGACTWMFEDDSSLG